MTYWLDYSAAKLSGATIRAAGYTGVVRYIDSPNRWGVKHTNFAEYQDHLRNGLGVRLVFEVSTGDPDGGYAQGVAYAQRAKAGADTLGYSGVIYFCEDRPTTPSIANWQSYLRGAISVLGRERVGAYGFYRAMDAAYGIVDHFWQAGARRDVRPHVQLWQDNNTQVRVGGVTCDRNLILHDLGPSQPPVPVTNRQEEEPMAQLLPTTVLPNGNLRYHLPLFGWNLVKGRFLVIGSGWAGVDNFEVFIRKGDGNYVGSPAEIPDGAHGKALSGSLAADDPHWLTIPYGALAVSVEIDPGAGNAGPGAPTVYVFTDA